MTQKNSGQVADVTTPAAGSTVNREPEIISGTGCRIFKFIPSTMNECTFAD